MPFPSTRSRNPRKKDTALFVAVLLLGVAGFGILAAYEHGYFEDNGQETRLITDAVNEESASDHSPEATRLSGTSPDTEPHAGRADLLSQPTLLTEVEPKRAVYDSLSDSERDSLQRIADAVDTTLKGKRYQEPLSTEDLLVADRYSMLINPARWQEFWYRTAFRAPGFSRFRRLRDRGDEDDFRSAAVAWVRLEGYTRGTILEALQAIADGDEKLMKGHRETIEQYPFILGVNQFEQPLRAPRP